MCGENCFSQTSWYGTVSGSVKSDLGSFWFLVLGKEEKLKTTYIEEKENGGGVGGGPKTVTSCAFRNMSAVENPGA